MERVLFTLVVLNLISISKNVLGDAVAFFPPDARAVNQFQYFHPQFQQFGRNAIPQGYVLTHENIVPQEQMEPRENVQSILHTSADYSPMPPNVPDIPIEGLNYTTEVPRLAEDDDFRAAKSDYPYPAHSQPSYPQAPSYDYSSPHTSSYSPPQPAPAAPAYPPPASQHPSTSKFSILKPDLTSLIKPVTTKVAGKVSGLIGLVLSLLTGTATDDLEMKGFKEIVINGIVKPLLVAKGGIKSLISKLTIPVISLLLINLEVLITVWWLWEECPEPKPMYGYTKPAYAPTATNYNSYR